MSPSTRRLSSLLLVFAAAALAAGSMQPASAISLRLRHAPHRSPAPKPTLAPFDAQMALVMNDVKVFKTTRNIEPLQLAIYSLSTAPRIDTTNAALFVAQRRALVRGWAATFGAIDVTYGQKFNAADPPLLALACSEFPTAVQATAQPQPTATPGTKGLFHKIIHGRLIRRPAPQPQSCVNPNTIRDERTRKAYELRLNHYYEIAEPVFEARLHQLDGPAMNAMTSQLERIRESAPAGTPSDFSMLDAELEQGGVAFERRARLDTVFIGDAQPWR